MKIGERVRDKLSREEGFVEGTSEDGEIVKCVMGYGPDRRLLEIPIGDLEKIGPPRQDVAGEDYDPFTLPNDGYKPF